MEMAGTGIGIGIPLIDLEDDDHQCGKKLLEACEEWGCFRVVNHNIPAALLSQMKSVVQCLFERPEEVKRRNADAIAGSGYVALNPDYPLYEALGLYDINSHEALDTFCSQLDATPQERETIKLYADKLRGLGMEIACKIAESMGLSRNRFEKWPCQFRINKYHFTEETVGSIGVVMHTDSSFLTVLQEDECVGGLEVMDKTGEFVPIDPFPGSLLVNLGDVAKAWSNGRLCNVKHRVQCKKAAPRFSIAMFLLGPKDEEIEAPSKLLEPDLPRVYNPFTYEDYRKLRLSSGYRVGEALELYAIKHATV